MSCYCYQTLIISPPVSLFCTEITIKLKVIAYSGYGTPKTAKCLMNLWESLGTLEVVLGLTVVQ